MTEREYFARTTEDVLADAGKSTVQSSTNATVDSRGRPIGHTGLRYGGDAYHDKQSASYSNYLAGKAKHGSSSAWYDEAAKAQKEKQSFVETLQQQITDKQKSGKDRYHLTEGQKAKNSTVNRPWMSENWNPDTKTVEDLQKELEKAQQELKVLDEELAYATEWRHYDADKAWLDNVTESGQDWGFVSDNLYKMYGAIDSRYNEVMDSIQKAEKNNGYLDNLRRQGGIPAEVGFEYTGAEELAKMYDELYELGELRDMANRRYGYSLDELAKDSTITEWGRLRAEGIAERDAQALDQAMDEYVTGHIKGDVLGAVRERRRNDYSAYHTSDAWTELERNRYYVILNRQGEEAAGQYAEQINRQHNLEAQQEATKGYYEFGKARSLDNAEGFKQTAGAALADTGRGLTGTALEILGMPGELGQYLDKVEQISYGNGYVDSNKPILSDYGRAISEGRAETLNELGTVGEKGLGDLYRLTGSMAQSLVLGNTVGSAGTLALYFGSAANQGFDEAMSRGATGEQAMIYGMMSGIGEAAAEIIPLENLLNADKSLTRGFFKAALYQAGFEGLEEGETDILNTIADQLVLKDKSEINTNIRMRMAQGESYEQAAKSEWSKMVKDVVWDMVGGAISGAGSSAIQYGVHLTSPYQPNAQGEYRYGADARTLASEAAAIPKEDKDLARVRSLGERTAAKVEQGRTVSNRTVEKLAKGTNRAAMVDAVEQQLNERAKSVKQEDRRIMANAIVSKARGEKPGPKGKRLMETNKEIADALVSELDVKKPAAWAQKIGVRGVDGIAYGDKNEIATYEKVKEDGKVINANSKEPMYAEVIIPTSKGEVKGKLVGLDMNKGKPSYIIQSENNKLNHVPVDEAIQSGSLPNGVARLAYESLGLGDIAADVYSLYSPGQDITDYVTNMDAAIELAADVSNRKTFNKSEAVQSLTKEQQSYAWNEGVERRNKREQRQRDTQTREKQKKGRKKGRVSFEGTTVNGVTYKATSKEKVKAADLRVIERIAKAANVDVVFYESDSIDGIYQGANGFYRDGTVYLDVHAGAAKTSQQDAILLTAAHELTHHIRVNAEAQYDALKEFVIEHLMDNDFEIRVQEKLRDEAMSREDAVEEVVADACEMVLKDSKAIETMAKENRSLAKTIRDWLHGFYEDIKASFEGVEARSKEAQAMTDYMDELVKLWDDALIEASKGESKQSGKTKASYAGRKAKTADNSLYQKALGMEKAGKSSEDIRKETGWFKGMDGQWRYEINDADMQFSRKGFFTNPDVLRFRELESKFIQGESTDEEFEELRALSKNLEGVRKTPRYLRDYIKHDELFKAYPELEGIELKFKNLESENGYYNYNNGEIVLDGRLRNNEEQLKDTLIHEIQHAIQHIEGFASGASPAYWQKRIDNGLGGEMRAADRKKAAARVEKLWNSAPNKLKEQLREREAAKAAEDWVKVFEIEAAIYDSENADLFSKMEDADFDLWSVEERDYELDAKDLYHRTAGEIEARDTATRRKLTAEQRKNTRPDIDREDVVFAGGAQTSLESDADIRYSRRDSSEVLTKEEARAQAQAYTRLKAENAALQRRLEYWVGQTKETKQRMINRNDVDKFAKQLVKMHGSTVNRKWLSQALYSLGDYIVQNEEPDINHARLLAWRLATGVIVNAEAVDDSNAYDNKDEILSDVKGARFHLDEMYRNDLPEGFRKQYSGKLHISYKDGRGVDSVYAELQKNYGDTLFPDMPTQADMLVMIGEAYDTLTAPPLVYNPYRSNMNETITSVTNDILDTMLSGNIREALPTVKDRANAKEQKAKQEGRERVKELRASKNARIEDIKRQESARRREAVAKEKAAKWEKVDAVKTHYRDQIKRERAERKESAAAQRYRTSIYKSIDRLSKLLLSNSDKYHVPEALKEPVLDFITSIDVSSRRLLKKGEATLADEKYTEKMQRLKTVLGRQRAYMQKPGEVEGLDVFLDLPDGFEEMIEAHIESMAQLLKEHKLIDEMGPISYMNSKQLQELDHILTVLSSSISQINSFITESRYESVKESARESRAYMRSLGTEVQRSLARDAADRFLSWGNALPIYVFKRFGDAGSERFTALSKGWGQMAMNAQFILNYANEAYTTEEVREWENEVHEISLSDGSTAQMTTAQIMGLYCSFKREQARRHLLAGGMRVGDIVTGKGNKTRIAQTDAFRLTYDDLTNIIGMLDARQAEVADKLQNFLNTTCADWGNEISMARFGYRQFTEENYYPITTDPNNFPAVDPQARENDIFRLLNMAFTKQLNPKANNSIVINSIFDVFSAHAADMAKYNALALPILDMMKWYNYKDTSHMDVEDSLGNINRQLKSESVQSMTERAYGKQAQNYMINFLKDLNGKREGGRNEDLLKGFLGKYKAAAVGANIRVAIQQPTSIVRASYVLSPVYLARGAKMKGGIEEALEHSGIAVWKSLGYFDTNIARGMRQQIKHADTGMDKLRDKGMWLAEQGDKMTWGAIWNACKLEQQDKGLKGEKLMKATADRFDEVILSTQVMDSTISRSDMMRNASLAVSEITSFMSEPTVSYNMLLDSVTRLLTAHRQTKDWSAARREAWPYMGRALAVFGASTFATAAAAALVDALRDDDDYQNYAEKWLEAMKKNTLQGINPAMLLPFISDLWEIAVKDETPESMLYQSFTQARKGVTAAVDMVKLWFNPDADVNEPNRTSWGRLYYMAQAVGSISGIPVAGFMREFKTVWNMSGALITGKKLKNYDSGVKSNIKYAVMDKYLEADEAVALLVANGEYTDPDDAYWAVQEWANAEDSEWDRYNEVYAAVLSGDTEAYEMAKDVLGDHGIAAASVRTQVKNQIGRWFIGGEDVADTMDEKTAVKALQDYAGLLPIEAQRYVDQLKFEKKYNMRYSDMKEAYLAGEFTAAEVRNFRQVYGHEKTADAAETVRTWDFEKESGISYSQIGDAYINGDISREQYAKWQKQYGGMTPAEIEEKLLKLEATRDYGVTLGSTSSGIKAYVLEGAMDPETGKYIMVHYDGKTEEQADAYMNQYLFTAETGYNWNDAEGVMKAYAAGEIDDAEAKQWFKLGLINGSDETAAEYLDVAKFRRDVPGAEEINREAIQKWNERGGTMLKAGLGQEDFAEAWKLYRSVSSEYDKEGHVVKEKKELFFDELYSMHKAGRYSLKEIDAIAKTVYAPSTVKKSAPW